MAPFHFVGSWTDPLSSSMGEVLSVCGSSKDRCPPRGTRGGFKLSERAAEGGGSLHSLYAPGCDSLLDSEERFLGRPRLWFSLLFKTIFPNHEGKCFRNIKGQTPPLCSFLAGIFGFLGGYWIKGWPRP